MSRRAALYHWIPLALVLLAMRGPNLCAAPTLDQLRRQAQGYYRDGQYPAAVRMYQRMSTLNPRNPDVLKEVMWSYWNMQQYDLACDAAKQVLKLHSSDPEAQNILTWAPRAANREKMFDLRDKAVKNYQAGRYDQAVEFYQELADLDPGNVPTLKDWLWALWSAERYDTVKTVANRILKLQPDDPATQDLLTRLPAALYRQKMANTASAANEAKDRTELEGAVLSYLELIRMKPKDPEPVRNLAWTYFKLKRFTEAVDVGQQLTVLRPNDPASWNLLARMQEACDDLEQAINSYETSLRIDPSQLETQTQIGKLYVRTRDLDRAIQALQRVRASGHASANVYPLLGKALFYKERYGEAAEVWDEAYRKDPSHFDYRFYKAQAAYYSGSGAGMKDMIELSSTFQDENATRFLINEALTRGDNPAAQELMEKLVPTIRPETVDQAMALANLYQTTGQVDKALHVLDQVIAVYPKYAKPLVMEGSINRERLLFDKAAALYRQALAINPNYDVARLGLAQSEFDMGHWDAALKEIKILRDADPTNPYLLLREARYEFEVNDPYKARRQLVDWVHQNEKDPVLPILLYHGLTPLKKDPRLAVAGNYRLDMFADQIHALRQAGYTPVSAEEVADWISGKHALPANPILITFDDGRLDSLRYADPVLEKYDFKATMFSVMANAGGARPIAYASWPQLLSYQQNGRWEIQSHGDQAHTPIPVDDIHMGLFIANRRWNPVPKELETPEEWRARVLKDFEDARKEISAKAGVTPVAYAYADGEYGQHQTNYPQAAIDNLFMVRQVYQVAFIEDNYGMNTRTRDPIRMTRLEPDKNWTGQELVTYLHDQNARTYIYQELLHQAMWRGRTREAYSWLTRLQSIGVSPRVLWGEEARIRYAAGDIESGFELASRMLTYSPEHFERVIEQNLAKEGPAWSPGFFYAKDNRERESYSIEQSFQFARWGAANTYLVQRWARFLETGYPSVTDNSGGFGVDYKPSLFHTVSLDARGHSLTGPAHNTVSANGSVESQWTDMIKTRAEAAHDIYFTARAIDANIEQSIGGLMVKWEDQGRWRAWVRGRYFALTDRNRRRQYQALLSRTMDAKDRLRLSYRYTYDDMNFKSPFYYSPQHLNLHEVGPEIVLKFGEHVTFSATYRAGLGKELDTSTEFVQDAQAELKIGITDHTWITPSAWYQKTPTYWQQTYGFFLRHRFGTLENMGVPINKEKEELL